jgi:hypothetical protein
MIESLITLPESKTLEFKRDLSFRELDFIEQWGSGVRRNFEKAAAQKLPATEIPSSAPIHEH